MKQNHHYIGLTDAQVEESRKKYGVNVLTPSAKVPLWKQFLQKFSDPLIVILLIAGMLSVFIACYEYWGLRHSTAVFFEPVGIFIAIMLATGLSFYFELKANREFSLLNQVSDDEGVKVYRNGNVVEIPKKEIVSGDVVVLNTGDEVPADGDLLEAVTLHVDESSLTGEPVCFKTTREEEFDPHATYPSNRVLRGTKVMEGHGIFKVRLVGDATENGKVFKEMQIDNSVKTPLNEQLDGLGKLITKLSYAVAALIIVGRIVHFFDFEPLAWLLVLPTALIYWAVTQRFGKWKRNTCILVLLFFFGVFGGMLGGIHHYLLPGQDIAHFLSFSLQTLMIAVTLLVVAVPEGLPMAVTLSLAYSMRSMLKTNNLVRKMHACETMGATTVICTDKTGTLTQNKMQVYRSNFFSLPEQKLDMNSNEVSCLIAEGIAVNSTASLDLTTEKPTAIGNPTEGALLLWLHSQQVDYRTLKEQAERVDEVPFSTERKYMATVVESGISGKQILFVKGAPEIVHGMCKQTCGKVSKDELNALLLGYQQQAMRTLGFAYQVLNDGDVAVREGQVVADNLTFLGIVAISDPVRPDVPVSIRECLDAGIDIKIVTGDTPGTAKEIGRQIGLWKDSYSDKNITTGPEFAALTDDEVMACVLDLKIIARARPLDKKRLVEALQRHNQVVAVTGDGTNDAPALKAAHVGLSMGDGTSVAKEASDITIMDSSFASIGRAVMWGRSLYQNIQRFLLFQLTVNVSASLIVLVGAFVGTESPLTVTQMLWVNLIMDTFGAMALASLAPSHRVMADKPRDRKAFILNRDMYANILGVGTAFFVMLLALLYIFQHADVTCMRDFLTLSLGEPNAVTPYEQTLLFSIFVWTHLWYMFNARAFETGENLWRLRMGTAFNLIIGLIVIGQIFIVEVLYDFFNVVPMKLEDWLIIVIGSSVVLIVREITRFFRNLVK